MTDLFDSAEFARRIDMSEDWVRRNRANLPHHRVGRLVKFSDDSVSEFKARTAINPYQLRQTPKSRARTKE